MPANILASAAALVIWSLIVLGWMTATRLPALARAGVDMSANRGGRGQDLERILDARVNWKAHNYTHLMEQPTLFYAVIAILALSHYGEPQVIAAWAYVGLRVVHSLWQGLVNSIPVRLGLFIASTLVLMFLAISALLAVL